MKMEYLPLQREASQHLYICLSKAQYGKAQLSMWIWVVGKEESSLVFEIKKTLIFLLTKVTNELNLF